MARRKKRWYDDANLLIADYEETEKNRALPLTESKTYAGMLFARPGSAFKVGEAMQVYDAEGLRELGFNSFAEAVDAGISQVVRPLKAKVVPVGGTWKQKRTCEALGQLIDGNLAASGFHEIARQLVKDGCWATESFAVWEDDGKSNLRCKRLDPLTSFMSVDGKEFKTLRAIPRREVMKAYGKTDELREIIENLEPYEPETITGSDAHGQFESDDRVAVYEAWREGLDDPPNGKLPKKYDKDSKEHVGKDYGCHVVQLAPSVVVLDEPWPRPVPVIRYHWDHGRFGPSDGSPLGRAVAPLMAVENQMHLKVSDAIAASVPMYFSKTPRQFSNAPFQHIAEDNEDEKVGTVRLEVPKLVSEDVRQHIVDVKERISARTGISESTAQGEPPPQFKSGIALQRYIGLLNKRLSQQHYNHLKLYEDSAKLNVILGPEIWSSKTKIAAAQGTSVIEQIDWEDVVLPEEAYRISFDAISDMPDHVPTKDELLEIMKDMQIEDALDLLANLNTPDYLRRVEVRTGPRNYMEFQISRALDDGVIEPPNDMQDKAMLAKNASEAWQAARCAKVRPDKSHMDALWVLWELAGASQITPSASVPTDVGGSATASSSAPEVGTTAPGAAPISTDVETLPA